MRMLWFNPIYGIFVMMLGLSACSSDSGFQGSSARAGAQTLEPTTENAQPQEVVEPESPRPTAPDVAATARPMPTSETTPTPEFATDATLAYGSCTAPCAGITRVVFNARYSKYIKLVHCSEARYDMFMGESASGPFYKIGDTGGHGQDHCELLNESFTIPHEDDVTSGTCKKCAVGHAGSVGKLPAQWGTKIYHRSRFGESFTFADALHWSIHTSCWYQCDVSF